jgi:hypothetical protein
MRATVGGHSKVEDFKNFEIESPLSFCVTLVIAHEGVARIALDCAERAFSTHKVRLR